MSLFELLNSLAHDGISVLLVSHQLNLVARFATKVVLLHKGHIVAAGAPQEVMQATLLEEIYEWPLVISRDPAVGSPSLVPLRRRSVSSYNQESQ
jgi:iron complex transport system ATP-binding protein